MGVIFFLSSRSNLPSTPIRAIIGHLSEYLILASLYILALNKNTNLSPLPLLSIALLLAVAFGVSDEIHQLFVPGRQSDIFDVLTDFIGASIAGIAYALRLKFKNRTAARS
jgi:VanZ family protein